MFLSPVAPGGFLLPPGGEGMDGIFKVVDPRCQRYERYRGAELQKGPRTRAPGPAAAAAIGAGGRSELSLIGLIGRQRAEK